MAPPIAVPLSLKKIKVFLTRASELDRDATKNPESRVVAYNCRQYAVLTGIPLAGTDAAAKACLGELLGLLEKEKEAMSVFSKVEHWKICRKVADRVFEKADGEDRGGVADKGTAKGFYAAGTFYEILQQYHDKKDENNENEGESQDEESKAQMEEEEQRRLYCKWKATEILNAIKEGRTPTPGGYQQQEEEVEQDFPLPPVPEAGEPNLPSIQEDLPPPPSMPTSDFYSAQPSSNTNETYNQQEDTMPQSGGIELSLNGDPTPIVEDVNEGDEDSGDEEIFIPGAAINAANDVTMNNNSLFVNDEPSSSPRAPPPPYPASAIPPPVMNTPLPPPTTAPNNNNAGMFSSLFGQKSPSKKLSRDHMADAVELTKFALAALQKGDGDLGKERLEQALGVWRR